MDFLNYQDFAVTDNVTSTDNEPLPEPVKRLNLSSVFTQSTNDDHTKFKLPNIDISRAENTKENGTLYENMNKYATLSIEKLLSNNANDVNHNASLISSLESSANNSKSTDLKFLINQNSNNDITNMVLSKKLSNVLNDYNLNNYQNTMTLRKSISLLESNKDSLEFNVDKLINSEYIGGLARKTLRNDLENELLKEHITILEEFRPIVRRIKRLSSSIENIRDVSQPVLEETNPEDNVILSNNSILNNIHNLLTQIDKLKLKKQVLNTVKLKFTLDQVEDDIIQNGDVNEEFFKVVKKVDYIDENATYLLALPKSEAGTALISHLNNTKQTINRKTYNYLLDFLYNYDSSPSQSNLYVFQNCITHLSKDLEYFNEFIKRATLDRSKLILDEFLSQFDLNPKDKKPIVLSAHDPVRYVGDVLASVHSLVANEADFTHSLFNFEELEESEVSEFISGLDSKLLNEIVQALANSCRIRIEQVVRFEDSCIINFEIFQLLNLYSLMFQKKGISSENSLIKNLINLQNISSNKISEYFVKFVKENSVQMEFIDNTDLLPPEWVSEYLNKIIEFLEVYEKGCSGNDKSEDDILTDDLLQIIIREPFNVTLLKQLDEAFPLARKSEEVKISLLTIKINSFDLIKSRLQPFTTSLFSRGDDIKKIVDELNEKLNCFIKLMKELQIKLLFEKTGLGLYSNLFNMIFPIESVKDELDYDMYLSLNDNKLMSLDCIYKNVHDKLNDYLPQALTDVQENLLFKLTSPSLADEISEACFTKLAQFYGIFRKVLLHLYPDSCEKIYEILSFSEDEFNTLVGIETKETVSSYEYYNDEDEEKEKQLIE